MFNDTDWQPIQDLPPDWTTLASAELFSLSRIWRDQAHSIRVSNTYQEFLVRLSRKAAIETGIIERLYHFDRGITHLLVERGIDEALIPHRGVGQSPKQVVALIRSQEEAIQSVFDFVGGGRTLSTSYIKELHALLTEHQQGVEKRDQFGKLVVTDLLRGDWKKQPNNPQRGDGVVHLYSPPEQVAPQIEQLLAWHAEHMRLGVPPEVEAAWLHHRFTQIHPFEDGNGRVARLLASLIFIRAGWFPLVLSSDEDREPYISALEVADRNGLGDLIQLFTRVQKKAFIQALSLAEQTMSERANASKIVEAAAVKLQRAKQQKADLQSGLEALAETLRAMVKRRFDAQKSQIESELQGLDPTLRLTVTEASSTQPDSTERASYFRYQIVEVAKQLGYFANLTGYRGWVRLALTREQQVTELLASFHILGREYRGVISCTLCVYRKQESQVQELQPLSETPFQITELDTEEDLTGRFNEWLENGLIAGLRFWYDGL